MTHTVPLTVTPEASRYIAERGLQEPFQRLLDNIPRCLPKVQAVSVGLQTAQNDPEDRRIIFDVTREKPRGDSDPAEDNWQRWVIENFPPEEFSHFCLLSIYS
jgi:hypothetical protein